MSGPQINVKKISEELYRRFRKRCIDEGVTISDKVIELIEEYLKDRKKKQ